MDTQYKSNMEDFSSKVQDMVKHINLIVKQPHSNEIPGE